MPKTIDLEREFFKATKDLEDHKEIREKFLERIKELAEDFIEYKFRQGILGLKD